MKCTADAILALARGEIGVKESPKNSNSVKYNTAYYGRAVQGDKFPWCAAFLWWLFRRAEAPELYYGGGRTVYCPTLLAYHRKRGQGVAAGQWRPGDVIFFNFKGRGTAAHVGLCERWNGREIVTIDGNTGTQSQDNGGAVMRRHRDPALVVGAYRPEYAKEEIELTEEQVRRIVRDEAEKMERERAALPPSPWSRAAEAKAAGITDGTRPGSFATREEVATMLMNARGAGE